MFSSLLCQQNPFGIKNNDITSKQNYKLLTLDRVVLNDAENENYSMIQPSPITESAIKVVCLA